MVSAAVRSKAVFLLFFIHCLLMLPLFAFSFVFCSCFIVQYLVSVISLKKRVDCFILIAF